MANQLSVEELFAQEYGFDPYKIYCLATGKPFGVMLDSEYDEIISLVVGSNEDDDAAVNDLAVRVLASMRPSLKWNKFRTEGIETLRKTHPVETLAYLINRMFAPMNRLKGGITMRHLEERIRAFKIIESWVQGDATNTMTYMLLELDAKWGLDLESAPFNWRDFMLDAPSLDARVEMIQAWYVRRMDAWEKKLKQDEMQTRWMRSGNAVAKPAFMGAFMESQPLSATAIKKQEKQAEKDLMGGLLFELMTGKQLTSSQQKPEEAQAVIEPTPVFVPVRKMPRQFGVKSNG